MAKEKKEQAAKSQEEMTAEEQRAALAGFGEVDAELSAQSKEVDPFERMPTMNPGKPGFEEGQTRAGIYVRTKRVVSDAFAAGKIDPKTGEKYRLLHVLRNRAGDKVFGIWSVGQLGAAMQCLNEGDYIEITYTGVGEPLRKGQSGPHTFKFRGTRPDGSKLVFDWDKITSAHDDEEMPLGNAAPAPQATARQ